MNLEIQGRVALVLGSGGGLGRAIALALAQEGAFIVAADADGVAGNETVAAVKAAGGRARSMIWNPRDIGAIEDRVSAIEKSLGPIDILVNDTGGSIPAASTRATERRPLDLQSLLLPIIAVTDRILPGMKTRNWGRVIISASSDDAVPVASDAMSRSLRFSLVDWSKSLAREAGPFGVTCNVVVPGLISTIQALAANNAREKQKRRNLPKETGRAATSVPLGRYGRPREYADTVAFLASGRASYINGALIRVDGGLLAGAQ